MILADDEIAALAEAGMISPFAPEQVRQIGDRSVVSYGLSSYGYDIRLGDAFKRIRSTYLYALDPHEDNSAAFMAFTSEWIELPPNGFLLGVSVEHFCIPRDVSVAVMGKSSLARLGIDVLVTPMEAGWEGYLTIEIVNHAPLPVRLYAGEGIAQAQFFRGAPCRVSYADRRGRYQGQPAAPVVTRVP